MYIKTWHGTLVVVEANDGQLKHIPLASAAEHEIVRPELAFEEQKIPVDTKICSGPLQGYELRQADHGQGFNFTKDGYYLCADQAFDKLECNRPQPGPWETFYFVADVEPLVRAALKEYQLGNLEKSLSIWKIVQGLEPDHNAANMHMRRAKDLLLRCSKTEPTYLVWQCNQDGMWEHDWLHYLIFNSEIQERVDGLHQIFHQKMIVIDSLIDEKKSEYYRNAFMNGSKICLIHLSDEKFDDNFSCYQWCISVWRNYWSPVLSHIKNVNFFPLGYKSGFANSAPPASRRQFVWSFAGDIKKPSRSAMINSMKLVSGGAVHFTSSFGSLDSLATVDYRKLMDSSIFVPCPAGWINLDSFRVYEALEAGCIPIVEQRKGFDYFSFMYGPHPIPTVSNWDEAPELIHKIQAENKEEELRKDCYE